jgi:glycosyltransferase involved in cell wall biosynthesis
VKSTRKAQLRLVPRSVFTENAATMPPKLSIIVPAYNESARLGVTLPKILAYLNAATSKSELIVVDDGSEDETAVVAEQTLAQSGAVEARVLRYETNRGKGYAVRLGLLAASANIALFSDADLSTPITEVPKLVDPIRTGDCDLTFGSRALDRRLIGVHQPWRREQGGRVFNLIVRVATGLPFWDTQCGFKAFRMSVCRPLIEAAQIDRFGFDVELIYLAHLAQLRLREVPVRWDHNVGALDASGTYSRDSLRMINEVRRIRAVASAGGYSEAISAARTAAMVEAKHGSRAVGI